MSFAKSSSESCEESEKTIPPKKKSKSRGQQMVQIFQSFVAEQGLREREGEKAEKMH